MKKDLYHRLVSANKYKKALLLGGTLFFMLGIELAKASQLFNLMYLPPTGKFQAQVQTKFIHDQSQYDFLGESSERQEQKSYLLNYSLNYALTSHYFLGLSVDQYLEQNTTKSVGQSQYEVDAHGLSDLEFLFTKRLSREFPENTVVDLQLLVSPSIGASKISDRQREGNVRRGGTKAGLGIKFGMDEAPFFASGKFYVNHFFRSKKERTGDQGPMIIDPHTHVGVESTLQYQVWAPFFAFILGGLQFDTTHNVQTNFSSVEASEGLTRKFGGGIQYLLRQNLLTTLEVVKSYSDYQLSLKDDEKEFESENLILTLGLKLEF